MLPSSAKVLAAIAALGWLVGRQKNRETRRQVRIVLNSLRRYRLDDYEVSDRPDDLLLLVDEITLSVIDQSRQIQLTEDQRREARRECISLCESRCAISGKNLGTTGQVHHGVPLCYGGSWKQENLHYIDGVFHPFIHNEKLERPQWMNDAEWEKVEEFRALAQVAGREWLEKRSKRSIKMVARAA